MDSSRYLLLLVLGLVIHIALMSIVITTQANQNKQEIIKEIQAIKESK